MTPFDAVSRCDLHMHSDASVMNDEWYTKFFGCPESYANPVRQYELCKARGMSLVTLTDHDSIEGGLRLVDHSDFFLSEEVTTRFPENGCVMHVLVWNITEDQHKELQRRRDNIYDLSRYLRSTGLAHGLAHPLLSSNWRLDAVTLEKSLVLFSTLESLNGLVDRRTDPTMAHLLASLTPEVLETLSRKHGIPLPEGGARRPALTAGSDDHVHRRCGTVSTEIDGVLDAPAFLDKVMRGEGRPVGSTADMNRMSACIKHTSYEHFRRECKDGQRVQSPFVDLMDCIAGRPPRITRDTTRTAAALVESLVASAAKIPYVGQPAVDISQTPDMASAECDERVSSAVVQMSDALLAKTVKNLADSILAFDIYGVLAVLSDLTGALVAAAPMLFAANHFAKQESQIRDVWRDWTAFPAPNPPEHLAVFSDSLDKVDGVATWCGRFGQQASKAGRKVWFASCDSTPPGEAPADENKPRDPESIPLVARFDLPIYPGFELTIPSLAATVEMLWRKRITHLEVSTPGPMGLAGLARGATFASTGHGQFHTDLPDLLATLTGEPGTGQAGTKLPRLVLPRGGSRPRFRPPRATSLLPWACRKAPSRSCPWRSTQRTSPRTSPRRPPLPALASTRATGPSFSASGGYRRKRTFPWSWRPWKVYRECTNPPLLVVVGERPVRRDLEMRCKDKEFVVFLGFQQGEVLRNLYASASVFVFASPVVPSPGLVNLEALASGVPILVPDDSAIAQSLDHGNTAMFFAPNAEDLARTIGLVLDNPDCATRLAEGGRRHTLALWRKADFEHVWTTMVGALGIRTPS